MVSRSRWLLQRFDKRIRTAETAERALRAPVLAEIPLIPKSERGGIVVVEHPHSAASEALRLLGASLLRGQTSAASERQPQAGGPARGEALEGRAGDQRRAGRRQDDAGRQPRRPAR